MLSDLGARRLLSARRFADLTPSISSHDTCSTTQYNIRFSTIQQPSTIQYNLNPPNEAPFLEKTVHKLLWRGSPDGIWVSSENKCVLELMRFELAWGSSLTHARLHPSLSSSPLGPIPNDSPPATSVNSLHYNHHPLACCPYRWRESQRFRLLALTNSNSTSPRKLRRTSIDKLGREYQVDEVTSLSDLNARFSDVRATNGPVQCRPDLCELLKKEMEFVPKASLEDMGSHRYVFDVDGNA